jgi:2-acylglycerol O-acyltransferase 2
MESWRYFWPSIGFLGLALCVMVGILLATNLVVGLLAICLYGLIPKDLLFDSVLEKVRNPTVEAHLQETFQLHVRDPLPSRALFVWQPHGLVSISSVLYNIGICKAEGYTPNHLVTLAMWLYMPIFGDILRYFGTVSSDYMSMRKTLSDNESLSVMLGGVREMISPLKPLTISLHIANRTGIFRMALETGTPLVPVLTYGEDEHFSRSDHWIFAAINEWLYSTAKLGIPFPSWAALQNWTELSYKSLKPIHSYTGKPIPVAKIAPTDADITALRKQYIEAVQELFKETAPAGYSLEIV